MQWIRDEATRRYNYVRDEATRGYNYVRDRLFYRRNNAMKTIEVRCCYNEDDEGLFATPSYMVQINNKISYISCFVSQLYFILHLLNI